MFPILSPELFAIPLTGGSATLYPSSKIMYGELHSPVTNLDIGDKFISNQMVNLMFEGLLNAKLFKYIYLAAVVEFQASALEYFQWSKPSKN